MRCLKRPRNRSELRVLLQRKRGGFLGRFRSLFHDETQGEVTRLKTSEGNCRDELDATVFVRLAQLRWASSQNLSIPTELHRHLGSTHNALVEVDDHIKRESSLA